MKRLSLVLLLAVASSLVAADHSATLVTKSRSLDAAGYTPGDVGAAGRHLLRMAPADYPGDGSGETIWSEPFVPNPRDISNSIVAQSYSILNNRKLSDFVWAWGQFVDHDIDLTGSHPDNGIADIALNDPNDLLGPYPIPFARSDYDWSTGTAGAPRQQINLITAFIDASNVYGSDFVRAMAMRTFRGGRMRTSKGNLLPFNDVGLPNAGGTQSDLFLAGDVRANEQVGLTALHTLFVREHNRLARRIAKRYRAATDEEIYQLARKIVGAEMQIITYREFLPALLGPYAPSLDDYNGYDSSVDPTIANEFSTVFYRFGHSMLSPTLRLADHHHAEGSLPLRNAFFNPAFLVNDPANIDRLLRGFALQQAQEIDQHMVDDVRNFLFGFPGAGGLDLASLNIQRGRDHGLSDYNMLRFAYGLNPVSDFAGMTSDPISQQDLTAMYLNVDGVDAWLGGLCEDHLPNASVGELVGASLRDQFIRLRDGDPFFYLNDLDLKSRRVRRIIDLREVSLSRIIQWNTQVQSLPDNVFFVKEKHGKKHHRR
jgi:peroxidase